jgi:hypothetical protein
LKQRSFVRRSFNIVSHANYPFLLFGSKGYSTSAENWRLQTGSRCVLAQRAHDELWRPSAGFTNTTSTSRTYHKAAMSLSTLPKEDPTTQSNYLEIASKHVSFEWAIDFEEQIISGSVIVQVLTPMILTSKP